MSQHVCSFVAHFPFAHHTTVRARLDCGAHEQQICLHSSDFVHASPSSFVPLPLVMSLAAQPPEMDTEMRPPPTDASEAPPMHM